MQGKLSSYFVCAAILFSILACDKDDCVSCIAENPNGTMVAHEVECEFTEDNAEQFQEDFTEQQEQLGNTVTCSQFRTN